MTDSVTIEIHGLTDIQDRLKQLPGRIARRIVISSLRKGAAVIRKEAQRNVPVRTGALRKGFKVSRSRIHRGPQYGIYLTLKKGRGRNDPSDPFYGRWVEKGYKKGPHQIPGVFFMRRALESKHGEAVSAITTDADTKSQLQIRDLGL
jgi:HK97 gp10 family phage protein